MKKKQLKNKKRNAIISKSRDKNKLRKKRLEEENKAMLLEKQRIEKAALLKKQNKKNKKNKDVVTNVVVNKDGNDIKSSDNKQLTKKLIALGLCLLLVVGTVLTIGLSIGNNNNNETPDVTPPAPEVTPPGPEVTPPTTPDPEVTPPGPEVTPPTPEDPDIEDVVTIDSYSIISIDYVSSEKVIKLDIVGNTSDNEQVREDFTEQENFDLTMVLTSINGTIESEITYDNGYICSIQENYALFTMEVNLNNTKSNYEVSSINDSVNDVTDLTESRIKYVSETDNLQTLINTANENDILFLAKGTYTFSQVLFVNKELHIIGESKEETIIKFNTFEYGQAAMIFEREGSLQNITIDCSEVTSKSFSVKVSPFEGPSAEDGQEIEYFTMDNVISIGGKGFAYHFIGELIINRTLVKDQTSGGVGFSIAASNTEISNSATISNSFTWGSIGVMYSANNFAYPRHSKVIVHDNNNFDHVIYASNYQLFGEEEVLDVRDTSYVETINDVSGVKTQVFHKPTLES